MNYYHKDLLNILLLASIILYFLYFSPFPSKKFCLPIYFFSPLFTDCSSTSFCLFVTLSFLFLPKSRTFSHIYPVLIFLFLLFLHFPPTVNSSTSFGLFVTLSFLFLLKLPTLSHIHPVLVFLFPSYSSLCFKCLVLLNFI